MADDVAHLPTPAQIDAYGNGGFRFAGMSHRGSLLFLPSGVWAWDVARADQIDARALARIVDISDALDFVLIGAGRDAVWRPSEAVRAPFRECGVSLDAMATGPAVRTYNVMFAEGRRVAAALVAVD